MNNKIQIWEDCCSHHQVIKKGISLFENSEYIVETLRYVTNQRTMLRRSSGMESLLVREVEKVLADYTEQTKKGHLEKY